MHPIHKTLNAPHEAPMLQTEHSRPLEDIEEREVSGAYYAPRKLSGQPGMGPTTGVPPTSRDMSAVGNPKIEWTARDGSHDGCPAYFTRYEVGLECNRSHKDDFPLEMTELNNVVQKPLRSLLNEALAVNSTTFEDQSTETGEFEFVGSKTETALLRFARDLEWAPYQQTRGNNDIIQMMPFFSECKALDVAISANRLFPCLLRAQPLGAYPADF
ncbi:hypothetical protein RSAG8_10681, partial [Rhizoctonia solani AG-8 WAC10335]